MRVRLSRHRALAGRKLIIVERYDRIVSADGSVERIHQEDFCQATGMAPETKYEEDGGPSLQRIANEPARWGMNRDHALAIIIDLLDRAPSAIAAARDETAGVPSDIVPTIEGQLAQLRSAG